MQNDNKHYKLLTIVQYYNNHCMKTNYKQTSTMIQRNVFQQIAAAKQ